MLDCMYVLGGDRRFGNTFCLARCKYRRNTIIVTTPEHCYQTTREVLPDAPKKSLRTKLYLFWRSLLFFHRARLHPPTRFATDKQTTRHADTDDD